MKLSIIVPIYNVESYLKTCIESLLKITVDNFEIIFIDDGSTDSSYEIVKKYVDQHKPLKIIQQKNSGLGAARNAGMQVAKGEYIAFVDSDDYICQETLASMYDHANKTNADIVMAKYAKFENDQILYVSPCKNSADKYAFFREVISGDVTLMMCNKIFKKEIFLKHNITFPVGILYEDLIVSVKTFFHANMIVSLDEVYYYWRERRGSLSRKVTTKNIEDRLMSLRIIKDFLSIHGEYDKHKLIYKISYAKHMIDGMNGFIERYAENQNECYDFLVKKIKEEKIIDEAFVRTYCPELNTIYNQLFNKGKNMKTTCSNSNSNMSQTEINFDFTKKLNSLYAQIAYLKSENLKYAIYGNGHVGTIIAQNLKEQVSVIVDKDTNSTSLYAKTCLPSELKYYEYDKIIISVLGRENSIIDELVNFYDVEETKIIQLVIMADIMISLPITNHEKERLISLKDKFLGKRCFIVGNGPSLNKCNLELLKTEFTFGVNGVFYKTREMGFRPTFYMVEDRHVMSDNNQQINEYQCEYKFFPSIYKNQIKSNQNTYFFTADMGFYNENHHSYCIPRFSKDFSEKAYTGQSVTYMQIQLAYFLGFTEVYLIGMDYNYDVPKSTKIDGSTYESNEDDPNHFHPDYFGKGKKWHDPKIERVGWNYEKAKEVFDQEGRKMYNATVGGKLEIFDRVDFETLF